VYPAISTTQTVGRPRKYLRKTSAQTLNVTKMRRIPAKIAERSMMRSKIMLAFFRNFILFRLHLVAPHD
jgi:hypothetical protein